MGNALLKSRQIYLISLPASSEPPNSCRTDVTMLQVRQKMDNVVQKFLRHAAFTALDHYGQ